MKIGIVTGSHRKDSQSAKVGRFLSAQLDARDGVATWVLDLGRSPLPLWDEDIWSQGSQWSAIPDLKTALDQSDGFVVIAPEWHGMVPAALKNFFLLWAATGELSHKPALPCAVSAGEGGAYVISELRMSSYKNNRLCWLPEQLIARDVKAICNEDSTQNDTPNHDAFAERSRYALDLLLAYAAALRSVRNSGLIDHDTFMNGM
ncbi:MAG: NADPH-dependent oxidoreductase [Halieaceae bacterium]|nr:NADPH-dependent oxidoreductase [Halieaceae bacterium]